MAVSFFLGARAPALADDVRLGDPERLASSDRDRFGNEIRAVAVALDKDEKPLVAVLQRDKSGEELVSWRAPGATAKSLPAMRGKLLLGGDERLECFAWPPGAPAVAAFLRGKEKKILVASPGKDPISIVPPGDPKDYTLPRECLTSYADGDTLAFAWTQEGKKGQSNLALRVEVDGRETYGIADTRCCPCCRPALAMRPDGTFLVAYREEMEGDVRDIYLRAVPKGLLGSLELGEPVRVSQEGFKSKMCPMAGPALAAVDDNLVLVAYVIPGKTPELKVARSIDGGKSFVGAATVGSGSRPTLLVLADGALALVHDGAGEGGGVLVSVSKDQGATWGKPARLDAPRRGVTASGSAARTTFERKVAYVAWIETEGKTRAAMLRKVEVR